MLKQSKQPITKIGKFYHISSFGFGEDIITYLVRLLH